MVMRAEARSEGEVRRVRGAWRGDVARRLAAPVREQLPEVGEGRRRRRRWHSGSPAIDRYGRGLYDICRWAGKRPRMRMHERAPTDIVHAPGMCWHRAHMHHFPLTSSFICCFGLFGDPERQPCHGWLAFYCSFLWAVDWSFLL